MSWQISKINNATHQVTMSHSETQDTFILTIPVEHRLSPDTKLAYIKAQTDSRTPSNIVVTPKINSFYVSIFTLIVTIIVLLKVYFGQ